MDMKMKSVKKCERQDVTNEGKREIDEAVRQKNDKEEGVTKQGKKRNKLKKWV